MRDGQSVGEKVAKRALPVASTGVGEQRRTRPSKPATWLAASQIVTAIKPRGDAEVRPDGAAVEAEGDHPR
jgi:hypothetical protein